MVKCPLIGANFFRSYKLLVDLEGESLTSKKSGYKITTTAVPSVEFFALVCSPTYVPGVSAPAVASGLPTLHQSHGPFPKLLAEFADVCNSPKVLPAAIYTRTILHKIITLGGPASKYRRLDAEKLAVAEEEFRSLEKQVIIHRSSSSWASPLHMVKKVDGSWRPCSGFRWLNLQTEPDRYPVQNIAELTTKLHGARVFSKFRLEKRLTPGPSKASTCAQNSQLPAIRII